MSHNTKTFPLILNTKVAKIDYSEAHKNFFTEDGDFKNFANPLPKRKYSLKYHVRKAKNKIIKDKLVEIISLTENLIDSKAVYSKIRISFKTNFKYMTLEVFSNKLCVCVKNKGGWKCFTIKSHSNLGRIKKALHRIHGLSRKPRLKKYG
jgi:hypothetical protein